MAESDDEPDPLIGTTIGEKYRIDRLIGKGGMGSVFEATHTGIGKRVALKFLEHDASRDDDAVTRFQREAESASAVESAHIVQIFDSGVGPDTRPFLVMEYLTGEDLRHRIRREGRLEVSEAAHIVAQVLRALARAHAAGIVHRDLKPDNIFLCERDDDPTFVKIVDFGISKARRTATADTLTRKGTVLGTAFYMSPEQAQAMSDIDGRADLWSVGAILYEALSGQPPHTGNAYEAVLIKNCTQDVADVRMLAPNVSEEVSHVIARALERDRDERFQSATEFYDALAEALPDTVRAGMAPTSTKRDRIRIPSNHEFGTAEGTAVGTSSHEEGRTGTRKAVVAAVVAAAGAFALTAFLMRPSTGESDPAPTPSVETPPRPAATPAGEPRVEPVPTPSADPAESPDAAPPKAVSKGPRKPVRVPTRPTTKKPPSPPDPPKKTGVAGGLELDTSGP